MPGYDKPSGMTPYMWMIFQRDHKGPTIAEWIPPRGKGRGKAPAWVTLEDARSDGWSPRPGYKTSEHFDEEVIFTKADFQKIQARLKNE